MLNPTESRRRFLKRAIAFGAITAFPSCSALVSEDSAAGDAAVEVNDVQAQLNATIVRGVFRPRTTEDIVRFVHRSKRKGDAIAVCGGRHAMGGQQFAANSPLLDTTDLNQILSFDSFTGTVTVQSGIQWPALIDGLLSHQVGIIRPWTIRVKQSGVDRVSIGGSVASNIHGRTLEHPPFVSDIESLRLVDGKGEVRNLSRTDNSELFSLVCGGYGLFGIVTEVTLRLVRRQKLRRLVEVVPLVTVLDKVKDRIKNGFLFGDCQYAVDLDRSPEHYPGVLSCYEPVPDDTPIQADQKQMSPEQWAAMYELTRRDKPEAFRKYSQYCLQTTGQIYWSDLQQLAGDFFRGYRAGSAKVGGTELLLEVYVTPDRFLDFMAAARKRFLVRGADVTFGTIRFIKQDSETFLAWAKEDSVCIACNLHVEHTSWGIAKVAADFRDLIDCVLEYGGRYYLTYHRFARPDQLLAAYPQFTDLLKLKRKYDPELRFQSDWYRHYS